MICDLSSFSWNSVCAVYSTVLRFNARHHTTSTAWTVFPPQASREGGIHDQYLDQSRQSIPVSLRMYEYCRYIGSCNVHVLTVGLMYFAVTHHDLLYTTFPILVHGIPSETYTSSSLLLVYGRRTNKLSFLPALQALMTRIANRLGLHRFSL